MLSGRGAASTPEVPNEAAVLNDPAAPTAEPDLKLLGAPAAGLPAEEAASTKFTISNAPATSNAPAEDLHPDPEPTELTAGQELKLHWPVLVLSCVAYVLLQSANAFVPAVTMQATSADLGISVASFAALNSAGAGIKSICILFIMGPALDAYGPPALINTCLVGGAICNLLTAFCGGPLSFSAVFLLNYVFNSFAEQPAYICLYATYFNQLLGATTTAIASAFSFAGFIMPPLLSPLLVAFGWRAPWLVLAALTALVIPFTLLVLKPGPIAIKPKNVHLHHNFVVDAMVVILSKKLLRLGRQHHKEKEAVKVGHMGRRMSYFGSAADPSLILHSLDKHHAIAGHDHENHDHEADVTLAEALKMAKFWALVVAAFSFFLYGGALNLHLPSILHLEAGLTAIEAASVFSTYNFCAVAGKVLTGVFLSTPALKRSLTLYIPFQLAYLLSHLMLFDLDPLALLQGNVDGALTVAHGTLRLTLFSMMVGLGYGFCASLMQCLVKEFFGLADLPKIQPIIYGCVILGCMGGMAIPGVLVETFGTYRPFLLLSLSTTTLNFSMFLALYLLHPIGQAPPVKKDML